MDVPGLRRHVLDEIRRFEEQARASGVSSEVVLSARYTLCAGLDEAVLSTPWGNQSEWAQHPLLVALHREAWGGEKFFDMLDRMSADPARYIDLMELQYLCLAFGFTGKYQIQERGQEHLQSVQRDLYRKIRSYRGQPEAGLSLRWRGLEDQRNPLVRYVPWWIVGAAALPILAIAFTAFYASLAGVAAPVQAQLARVGVGDFSPPQAAVPVRGPTLKELLATDERSGALSVKEDGNRSTVTLLARDLFPSGGAEVNPAYDNVLERVTSALNKVPGRVVIVGHTDDQPIKSFRYGDNFDLSRARAASVSSVLQKGIDSRARLTVNGVGASEPLYLPASDPDNRARNRRVEIIHMRGT
jgi:type VI secretion system protein ImpK